MQLSKENELIGTSPISFEDAVSSVLKRAYETLRGIRNIEVLSKNALVADNGDIEYQVRIQLLFEMAPPDKLHW